MKNRLAIIAVVTSALAVGMTAVPVFAQDAGQPNAAALAKVANKKAGYSPYAGRTYPTRPFWGDTHVHTATSFDAGAFGSTLGPGDAYRFARGEEVISNSPAAGPEDGSAARLSRGDRSLGQHGFLPRPHGWQAEDPCEPDGSQVVRHGQGGQGRGCWDRSFLRLVPRNLPEGAHVQSRHARVQAYVGR